MGIKICGKDVIKMIILEPICFGCADKGARMVNSALCAMKFTVTNKPVVKQIKACPWAIGSALISL